MIQSTNYINHLPPITLSHQLTLQVNEKWSVFKKSPAFAVFPFHPNLTNVRWAVLMPLSRNVAMEIPFMEQWRNPQTNKWLGKYWFAQTRQGKLPDKVMVLSPHHVK